MKKTFGLIGLVSGVAILFAGVLQAAAPSKQVAEGKTLYAEACALCHGADGKRGEGFQTPIWGEGSLIATKFGTAQGLIDYMQLMPFNNPAMLTDEQKLSVVAYLLSNHGAIPATATLDAAKAASIPIK
ncbi:MAG: cytochrome c [Methylobacterium sp.]|jgi:polar amino acid transport system substrate-binding protein|nr:cytochrome c [Methylobacterium sp.]MCA3637228.1 cytochrome c [Methylobacterium sp.]MCA3640730.1 cytochrome c [Methylobacterium sp.]MCA3655376.1 cytochrome c [Methylobacterium sp.]MCA3659312.1 cytochrome c [Methylobacterium sp.]